MEEQKVFFQDGWLVIDVGRTLLRTDKLNLVIRLNKTVTKKISPTKLIGTCIFFHTKSISFGEHQLLTFDGGKLSVDQENNFDILRESISSVEQIGDRVFLTRVSRQEWELFTSKSDTPVCLRIPALKLIDRVVLFNNKSKYELPKDVKFGQIGTVIHYEDGTNFFETSAELKMFKRVKTQKSFKAHILKVENNKVSIALDDNLRPDAAMLLLNDAIVNADVNDNILIFDFSQNNWLQQVERAISHIEIIVKDELLTGELRFDSIDYLPLLSNIVISNSKLIILGNLQFITLPEPADFEKAETKYLDIIEASFGTLTLKSNSEMGQTLLVLKRRNKNIYSKFAGEFVGTNNALIKFDLNLFFCRNLTILSGRRWDAFLVTYNEATVNVFRIVNGQHNHQLKYQNYGEVLGKNVENETTYDQKFEYYFNAEGQLSLVKNSESKLLIERFDISSDITNIKIKSKSTYKLNFKISGTSLSKLVFKRMIAVNRNKHNYFKVNLPTKLLLNSPSIWEITANFKINASQLVPFYWDIYAEVEDEYGEKSLIQIQNATKSVRSKIRNNVFKWQTKSEGQLLAPYITVNNNLAFVYHPVQDFETPQNYFKENMARVIEKLFRKRLKKKHIWITYEKNAMGAHDNAFTFFEYMYKNRKHDQFYYVIRRDSPELKNLAGMDDRVLKFMSLKYFIYMFAAELFISSDTKYHGYNLHQRDSHLGRRMARVKEVYLQHGVNGLKQVPAFHKKRGLLDFIIVPDEYEKKMVVKQWGYEPKSVAVTGLARWDKYVDLTRQLPFRQIFVMPTWRKWMDGMSEEEFVLTPFYKQYQTFLSSPRLKKLLIDNNTRIAFFLHPYFKDYVHLFNVDSSVIDRYGYLDVNMGEAIQKSSMMISDYSSVLWDMYYLKKPVLFYQFDQDDYLANEKSYMDYDTELFGDVTFDSESTIDMITYYINRNFLEKPEYAKLRDTYFTYMDHHNSERIYKAIRDNKRILRI